MTSIVIQTLCELILASAVWAGSYEEASIWTDRVSTCYDFAWAGDSLVLISGYNYGSSYLWAYQLNENGGLHYADGYMWPNADVAQVCTEGERAWHIVEQNDNSMGVVEFDISDPGELEALHSLSLGNSQRPQSLWRVPAHLLVCYNDEYLIVPTSAEGFGQIVSHSFPGAAKITVAAETMLMPDANQGGTACRITATGEWEDCRELPGTLSIDVATCTNERVLLCATSDDGRQGLFLYDYDCLNELAFFPLEQSANNIQVEGSRIALSTEDRLHFLQLEEDQLHSRGWTLRGTHDSDALSFHGGLFSMHSDRFSSGDVFLLAELRGYKWLGSEVLRMQSCSSYSRLELLPEGHLAIGGEEGRLQILRDTPGGFCEVSHLMLPGTAYPIWQRDGLLVVSLGRYLGMALVDCSQAAAPRILSTHTTPYYADKAVILGNRLYTADGPNYAFSGITVFDISDPTQPSYIGRMLQSQCVSDLAIGGDYLAALRRSSGYNYSLQVWNMADTELPESVFEWSNGSVTGVVFREDLMLVSTSTTLYSFSLPDFTQLGSMELFGGVADLYLSSSGVYTTGSENYMGIVTHVALAEDGQFQLSGMMDCNGPLDMQIERGRVLATASGGAEGYGLYSFPAVDELAIPELHIESGPLGITFLLSGGAPGGIYTIYQQDGDEWIPLIEVLALDGPQEVFQPMNALGSRGVFRARYH